MINPILCSNYEDYEAIEQVNASIGVPALWEPEACANLHMNDRPPTMQECVDFVDSRIKQLNDTIDQNLTVIIKGRHRANPPKPETIERHRALALNALEELHKTKSIRENIEDYFNACMQAYLDRR